MKEVRWCTNSAYFLWRISNLIFNFLTQIPSRNSTWSGDTPWSKFDSRPKTNKKRELQCVWILSHCTFIHKWSKVEMLSINPWQLLLLIKYTFIQHKAFLLTCIWYWYILAEYTQTSATLKLFSLDGLVVTGYLAKITDQLCYHLMAIVGIAMQGDQKNKKCHSI